MEKGKLKISKNCVSEELGDELIILDLESGLYHSLNKIGSYIWEEIKDKNPSYDNLKKSISQRYIGENVLKELDLFLEELKEKRLIYLK